MKWPELELKPKPFEAFTPPIHTPPTKKTPHLLPLFAPTALLPQIKKKQSVQPPQRSEQAVSSAGDYRHVITTVEGAKEGRDGERVR